MWVGIKRQRNFLAIEHVAAKREIGDCCATADEKWRRSIGAEEDHRYVTIRRKAGGHAGMLPKVYLPQAVAMYVVSVVPRPAANWS